MQVYVLLFNAGTDNEGIHSLQANGRNTVLMFEDEDDATRFGLMLEAQDFPTPDIEAFEQDEIEEFCEEAGFDLRLIPAGSLMVPPDSAVEAMDWDPDGEYVAEEPPTADESRLSNEELDDIRQRLEKLL
ncbi:DUF3110 domain-containing protein [Leptolyngbya iicbica]|uniref:DUF3110 domain-containing protein n=2 Tax=Cyanophyceae TaxID=3028117 RepID=A0A4Q7E3G5_9CYAN|nr:DUF3110 domain-containing protein [Leptolyngbya sp. LK]RZM76009.1 DUF3110 domain-containing protein [Leptolyngbya sp. LK]